MLIVPFGWDQPDNAARVERLGVGLHVPRGSYTVASASAGLKRLLEEPGFMNRATMVAQQVRGENGLKTACDAIESVLRKTFTP
jgi:UDP:flavonoid glycosyltransferase YjiC (YdhE family)